MKKQINVVIILWECHKRHIVGLEMEEPKRYLQSNRSHYLCMCCAKQQRGTAQVSLEIQLKRCVKEPAKCLYQIIRSWSKKCPPHPGWWLTCEDLVATLHGDPSNMCRSQNLCNRDSSVVLGGKWKWKLKSGWIKCEVLETD